MGAYPAAAWVTSDGKAARCLRGRVPWGSLRAVPSGTPTHRSRLCPLPTSPRYDGPVTANPFGAVNPQPLGCPRVAS